MTFQQQIINYHYSQIPPFITDLYNLTTSNVQNNRKRVMSFFDSLLLLSNYESERLEKIRKQMIPKLNDNYKLKYDGVEKIIYQPRLERDFGVHPLLSALPHDYSLHIDHMVYVRESLREQYHYYHLYCFDLCLDCAYRRNEIIKMELALKRDDKKGMHLAFNVVLQNMTLCYISLTNELQTYLRILKSYRYEFADQHSFPAGHHVHDRYYGIKATFPLVVI